MTTLVDAYANRGVPFTMAPNSILRGESGLSDRAIAVLCEIMSHRDGFNLRQRDMAREGRGSAAVRSAIEELTEAGYIIRAQQRGKGGKFGRNVWVRSWTPIPEGERDAILDSDGYYAPGWRKGPDTGEAEEPEKIDPPADPEPKKKCEKPVAVAVGGDDPAQHLLELAQKCGVNLSIMQASVLWAEVDKRLDGEDRWGYLRFKLADLAETDYPARRKFDYLRRDIDKYIDEPSELAVGAHEKAPQKREPEPPTAKAPTAKAPKGGAVDEATEVWSKIVDSLRETHGAFDLIPLQMLQPIDIGDGKLAMWSNDPKSFELARETLGDPLRSAADEYGVTLVYRGGAR